MGDPCKQMFNIDITPLLMHHMQGTPLESQSQRREEVQRQFLSLFQMTDRDRHSLGLGFLLLCEHTVPGEQETGMWVSRSFVASGRGPRLFP